MGVKLQGVVPPVATSFGPDEALDLNALQANLRAWNATSLGGYLVLGSNGESGYLSEKEREEVIAAAHEARTPEKTLMIGTGLESTRHTIAFTRRAAELGADCALVVSPCYYKGQMTPAALEVHYQKVAEAATIPVLVYNVPQFTGVNLPADLVARLSRHPNIVGCKDSSGNLTQLGDIIRLSQPGFAVFVGSATVFYPALCLGAVGGILAVANVLPRLCVAVQDAHQAGDHAQALALQRRLTPLAQLVTTGQGIGGLKRAMDLVGYAGGPARWPLPMPASNEPLQKELDLLKDFWPKA
mgnify:FL=1